MGSKNIKAEAVLAILFLLLSLWAIFIAIPSEINLSSTWSTVDSRVNSRTFPYFAAIIMGTAALIQLISVIKKYIALKKTQQGARQDKIIWQKELRAIAVFAVCVVYGILFVNIGYIFATLITTPLVLVILGDRKWQHYLIVYGVGAAMYGIFQFLLKIRLP
ncbi:MAG: tripartite tricarboxylate transporter TctB family protein [Spirochaetia bacterium]|nr:tripartite tricarboxylate transporter TctB family protein [Spirochaetia bacterium]